MKKIVCVGKTVKQLHKQEKKGFKALNRISAKKVAPRLHKAPTP